MAEIVSLTCSSCGGKLQIPASIEQFACGYCGTEFTVNRGGGIVSLDPVVDGLKSVQRGVDKTASELAIVRLQREADALVAQRQAIDTQSQAGLLTWVTVVFLLGAFLLAGRQLWLGGGAIMIGVLFLITAFNNDKQKLKQLNAVDQQYAAKVSEIDKHKAIVDK